MAVSKSYHTLSFLLWSFVQTFAQSGTFNLEMEGTVQDTVLTVNLYIRKTSGDDFALGTSNFDIHLKDTHLDVKNAQFFPGEFDIANHADSYDAMGLGNSDLIVLNVRVNVQGNGTGVLVSDSKKKLGTIQIPILDPCATVTATWSKTGTIHSFFRTAFGTEITQNAVYVDPAPIDLGGGVSKTIPTVTFEKGKLISSSLKNNQWYLDGTLIPGATGSEFVPLVPGKYAVEVTYPCSKNQSLQIPVVITGLSDFAFSSSFSAQPNPFLGESTISYTLANDAIIKLQLYDLSGAYRMDLETGQKAQGKHTYLFKLSSLGLPAGTYVIKLAMEDKLGTLKIVALK